MTIEEVNAKKNVKNGDFILHPISDKNKILFTMKRDKRRKRKPVHIEFKMNGGTVIGNFILVGIKFEDGRYIAL